jgi:hypothetical protein
LSKLQKPLCVSLPGRSFGTFGREGASLDRIEILHIWQCVDSVIDAARLPREVLHCLPPEGFRIEPGFGIDIVFDERLHDPKSQTTLMNMGLPAHVFETLQSVFRENQPLIDALNRAAPIMRLDFDREGHFWLPECFCQHVSGSMLSRLIASGLASEAVLSLALARDLGL